MPPNNIWRVATRGARWRILAVIREVLQSGAGDDPVGATWDGGAQCIATNSFLEDLSRKSVPGTELVLPLTSAVSLSCGARGYSSARTRAR